MDWARIAPPLAASIAIFGACLAALFAFLNTEVQKSRKRKDLYRLLRAEITNLERHCRLSADEIPSVTELDISNIRITKYKDGNMILFDPKESYLLNKNICQDIMQLGLLSRNDDIFIDELVVYMRSNSVDKRNFEARRDQIATRLSFTDRMCLAVAENLDVFSKNPRSYNRPTIDW